MHSLVFGMPTVEAFAEMSDADKLATLYMGQLKLMNYVEALEKKAEAMGSPEGMAKMMESFTGGMFGGMKF